MVKSNIKLRIKSKMKSKMKSNKGYVFTYEAIIVAFLFISMFYVGYMAYSHNFLTELSDKKDTEKFDKALYLKDYYLKKYSFPGDYPNDYIVNFVDRFNFNAKTFDLFHNFSSDENNVAFIIHSNEYDEWLKTTPINEITEIPVNFSGGENYTLYSNIVKGNIDMDFSIKGNYVKFNENAYVPKITYHNISDAHPKIYGCNGDVIYFLINGADITQASAKIYVDTPNTFNAWTDWKYISPVLIKNNLNTGLSDYDVKIVFDSSSLINNGEMNWNCSDVRFIDESGNELPYWIEPNTIDTDHTVAWVKLNLNANEVKRIYMLYGNPNAESHSNGKNTFIFFDNFSEDNLGNWDTNINKPLFKDGTYNNGIDYKYLYLNYNYYNLPQDVHITSINDYDNQKSVRFHANFHQDYDEWAGFYLIDSHDKDYNRQIISNYHWGGEYLRFESSETDYDHIEYRILPISYYDTWHTYEIQRNGDNSVNLWIDDDYYRSIDKYIYSGKMPIAFYAREYDTTTYGYSPPKNEKNGYIDVDWVFVRKYQKPEPEVVYNSSDVIFTVNGKIYRKPLLVTTTPIDITPDLRNNDVNEIRILNSAYPIIFNFDTTNNADFYYVVFSPRNITIMVKQ
jgi:hypothetical protein